MEIKNDCLEKKNDTDEEKIALPGFRFHPTDEELVAFYLRRKVDNKSISIEIIKEIDVYKFDPWDLPIGVSSGGREKEWYFFSLRGRKYRNSIRPNRVTGSGFWKATGIDRPIMNSGSENNDTCIGLKKSLVYYIGSAGKGKKTDWMMHEFRLPSNSKDTDTCSPSILEAEIWTICRIFKRNICSKKAYKQTAASTSIQTAATDSSSKTNSSVDSDHTNNQDQYSVLTPNQIYAAQYINHPFILHSPVSTTNSYQYSSNNYVDTCGNWDELGRIVDYCMTDHITTAAASQDSTYY